MRGLTTAARRIGPGDLTEAIEVQIEAEVADGYGGSTRAWSAHATLYAEVTPISAREPEIAGGLRSVIETRFTTYRRDDVTIAMRIVWRGRPFAIKAVRLGPARELFMDIIAETGQEV